VASPVALAAETLESAGSRATVEAAVDTSYPFHAPVVAQCRGA